MVYSTVSANSTSNGSYILIPNMTITPPPGNYMVFFQGSFSNSAANAGLAYISIFVNGVQVPGSQVAIDIKFANNLLPISCNTYATGVTAAIEVRWKITNNTETVDQRSLIIQKVN